MTYNHDRAMARAEEAWLTPPEDDDHYHACHCHEDQPDRCLDCDTDEGAHDTVPASVCDGWQIADRECTCAELEKNEAADRADAANDQERE